MGWFSRKNASQDSKPKKRATTSNETEIRELKVRARRRLLGSIVLILFAIIVVPMMFDDSQNLEQTPVVIPADIPKIAKPEITEFDQIPDIAENEVKLPENTQEAIEVLKSKSETEEPSTADPIKEIVDQNKTKPTADEQISTPDQKPTTEQKPKPTQDIIRSDDGSEALALLQGHTPDQKPQQSTTSPKAGNFILQIAAYSTEQDANTRRDKLIESGISNAYVEQANSNGKTTYRLRIGSFKTRQAAQAAQTRIRALGYDNSLLISQ